MVMGQWARWKRRYRKAKRIHAKVNNWFNNDPMKSVHAPKMVTVQTKKGKYGRWKTQNLSTTGKYPDPTWETWEDGRRVYGPVRDETGSWNFYDVNGNVVYGKGDRERGIVKKTTVGELRKQPGTYGIDPRYDDNQECEVRSDGAIIIAKGTYLQKGDNRSAFSDKLYEKSMATVLSNRYAAKKTSKKRITMCGKKRADGGKCRRRGDCPDHRNHMW
jgi:hypothetical protein